MTGKGSVWKIYGIGGVTPSTIIKFVVGHAAFEKNAVQILEDPRDTKNSCTTIYLDDSFAETTFFQDLKTYLDVRWPDRNKTSEWARPGAIYNRVNDAEVL